MTKLLKKKPKKMEVKNKKKLSSYGISKGTNDFKVYIKDIIEDVSINEMFKIPRTCGAYIITFKSGKNFMWVNQKKLEQEYHNIKVKMLMSLKEK